MKFAVFAAVSSLEQAADDKDSIPNQIAACRAVGLQAGGTETAVYIADGYSRSFYDGLTEAMQDIPALKDAMDAAARHEYDVLICYYYERFGDIAKNVLTRLSRLKIQFVSVNEPTPIVAPQLYDPAKDQTRAVLVAMSDVKNNYRISRIINNFRDALPRRVKDGLKPGAPVQYGYRLVSSKMPLEQDPEQCAKLLQAKQMLFDGRTYREINLHLGLHPNLGMDTLANPFYAGIIVYNRTTEMDGARIDNPRHKWLIGEGKHKPLWTIAEHEAILAELARRNETIKKFGIRHAFTGLLRCAVCGGGMKRNQYGTKPKTYQVVECRAHGAKHVVLRLEVFTDFAIKELQRELSRVQSGEVDEERADQSDVIRRALVEKGKKRRKIQEGFENELYTAVEASKLLKELDKETEQLDRDLERIAHEKQNRAIANGVVSRIRVEDVPVWITHDDPRVVNRLLSAWLREIQVSRDGVKVVKR